MVKKTFGKEPVLKRTSGGSVPISPFVNTLEYTCSWSTNS